MNCAASSDFIAILTLYTLDAVPSSLSLWGHTIRNANYVTNLYSDVIYCFREMCIYLQSLVSNSVENMKRDHLITHPITPAPAKQPK